MSACSRSTARFTTSSMVGAGREEYTVRADAAPACRTGIGGCGSSCPGEKAWLGEVEPGVCAVAWEEDESPPGCCAYALRARSREVAIPQCQIRITKPRERLALFQQFGVPNNGGARHAPVTHCQARSGQLRRSGCSIREIVAIRMPMSGGG